MLKYGNYWYVSRPNEIFLDIDNTNKVIRHASSRLLGAVECDRLKVADIDFHQSASENHLHVIITLGEDMPPIERAVWGLILRSDIYRAASVIMRHCREVKAADVLITPIEFRRPFDDYCECPEKHKAEIMEHCPAAIRLRGEQRTQGFFGLPSSQDVSFFRK